MKDFDWVLCQWCLSRKKVLALRSLLASFSRKLLEQNRIKIKSFSIEKLFFSSKSHQMSSTDFEIQLKFKLHKEKGLSAAENLIALFSHTNSFEEFIQTNFQEITFFARREPRVSHFSRWLKCFIWISNVNTTGIRIANGICPRLPKCLTVWFNDETVISLQQFPPNSWNVLRRCDYLDQVFYLLSHQRRSREKKCRYHFFIIFSL